MPIHLVFAVHLFNNTGVQAGRVVLALYALHLGAQPFAIGLLAATFSLFPMLLSVTMGKFADRFGSRWLLIAGAVANGVGMLLPFLFPVLPAIFAAAAMMSLSTAACNVSLQNLVGLLSDPQNRARNFANFSLIGSITNFTGPMIAGFSIEHAGHTVASLYLALLALVPAAMLAVRGGMLPTGTRHDDHATGNVFSTLAAPGVKRVLATGSLQHVGDSLYQFYLPVYAHAIGLSASAIGMILAMNAAASFFVRTVLPRLIARFQAQRVLASAFLLAGASVLLVPLLEDAVLLGLMSFLYGLGMGCAGPIVNILMFDNSPQGRSGETLGLKITVNHFTKVVSPVVFGALASAFGLAPIFWLTALMLGGGGMLSRPRRGR